VRTIRLQVTLREVTPPALRILDVPATSTLPELHELLQAGLGWTDSHLHEFQIPTEDTAAVTDAGAGPGPVRYGVPDPDFDDPGEVEPLRDETTAQVRELGARFVYLYDFGDGWTHDITVLGPGGPQPGCVYGEHACPPEDCGGPTGHAELCAVLADPGHPEHTSMRTWAGPGYDPTAFDQAATDTLIRHTAGRVPESVARLLELTSDGVRLTPAGRLPRALVRSMQHHRPDWAHAQHPAQREDDLPPLAALHDLLRHAGLLRLHHGALTPTRAANDPTHTIRRLRSWFGPDTGFTAVLAGTIVAALAHHGPTPLPDLAEHAHPLLGRWVHPDGTPLSTPDVRREISRLAAPTQALDLLTIHDSLWAPGPAAHTLIPRATALAHIWTLPRYRPGPDHDPDSDSDHHQLDPAPSSSSRRT
jgi:hypothetical protein